MRGVWMIAVVTLACGTSGTDPDGRLDRRLDRRLDLRIDALEKLQAELCACRIRPCADTAHDAYLALKRQNSKADRPSEDQVKRYEVARRQLQACWHTLNGTTAP
jgi:hypothetical protein